MTTTHCSHSQDQYIAGSKPREKIKNQNGRKKETGFSQLLLTPFHRCPAGAIRPHHPDRPEGNAMDTR